MSTCNGTEKGAIPPAEQPPQAAAKQLVIEGFAQDLALGPDENLRDPLVRQQIETGLLRSIRLYSPAEVRSLVPAYTEAVRICINRGIDVNTTLSWATELFRTLGVPEEQLAIRSARARLKLQVPDHHLSEAGNRALRRVGRATMAAAMGRRRGAHFAPRPANGRRRCGALFAPRPANRRRRRGAHFAPRPANGRRRQWAMIGGAVVVAVGVLALVLTLVTGGRDERVSATGPGAPASTLALDGGDRAAGTSPPTTGAASATTVAPTSRPGGRRGSGQAVTLAFGGDVHFEGQIRARLQANPASVMAGVAPLLSRADLAVVNLGTAITTRGTKPPNKQYAFRAPPSAFAALRAGGVDVASMANNHGMDYGRVGLEDSLDASEAAGLPVVGIGRNADEAYRPFLREVKGQRIAVISATQVLDADLRAAWTATDAQPGLASAKEVGRLTAAVRAAREQADTVVVFLDWGTEGQTCPNEAQPVLARTLAEAGADVIVGSHAHRLQGAGRLGDAFVAYGLGNFVFYKNRGPGTETGVLTVTVTGRDIEGYKWSPARLVGQLPRPLSGEAARAALAAWESLRGCTGLTT